MTRITSQQLRLARDISWELDKPLGKNLLEDYELLQAYIDRNMSSYKASLQSDLNWRRSIAALITGVLALGGGALALASLGLAVAVFVVLGIISIGSLGVVLQEEAPKSTRVSQSSQSFTSSSSAPFIGAGAIAGLSGFDNDFLSSANYESGSSDDGLSVNPATGLPMVGALDISGNPYGVSDITDSSVSSDSGIFDSFSDPFNDSFDSSFSSSFDDSFSSSSFDDSFGSSSFDSLSSFSDD